MLPSIDETLPSAPAALPSLRFRRRETGDPGKAKTSMEMIYPASSFALKYCSSLNV